MIVNIGVDIGQTSDPTAIAVDEVQWRVPTAHSPTLREFVDHHTIRHLERLELGQPYPAIVDRLRVLVAEVQTWVQAASLENRGGELDPTDFPQIHIYVDATGVGRPVVDYLKQVGVPVTGVFITNTDRRVVQRDEVSGDPRVVLGKAYMVSRMQAIMQSRRLHLPNVPEAHALAAELRLYEIRVSAKGSDTFGVFNTGKHDDLVTALGLAMNKEPQYAANSSSLPALFSSGPAAPPEVLDRAQGGLGRLSGLPNDPSIGRNRF